MSRTRRANWGRWVGVVFLVLIAGLFSFLNAGERVTINVGFAVLYRISLVGIVFAVFLLGMVTMFLFGLRQDLRVRAALRDSERQSRRPHHLLGPPIDPPD